MALWAVQEHYNSLAKQVADWWRMWAEAQPAASHAGQTYTADGEITGQSQPSMQDKQPTHFNLKTRWIQE